MNFLVSLVPILIPVLVSQLKGGAQAFWTSFIGGAPSTVASATVPGVGHVSLQLVITPTPTPAPSSA